jgi:hypothetical protein
MLSLQDCLDMCELSEDEVLAIAHQEHLPEITAAALAHCLVRTREADMNRQRSDQRKGAA